MKKFCAVFAIFCVMFLMIGCGSSSSSDNNSAANMGKLGKECYPNETCDKGLLCDTDNNVCVEDPENPINDSDRTDSDSDVEPDTGSDSDNSDSAPDNGDTTPDGGDTAPDNGDTTPDGGDTAPDNGDTTPDGGDTAPDNGDTTPDGGDTAPDNGDSADDSDDGDTGDTNEDPNPSNLPECSPESATPCIDSESVDSNSEKAYLIWSGKSPERLRWVDAIDYCKKLKEGGYSDWQLPTMAALKTLLLCKIDERTEFLDNGGLRYYYACEFANSAGENSKFGDIAFFWSASQGQGIDFYTGRHPESKSDTETFDVRCVRKEVTSRLANCSAIPDENAEWNTVHEITQTWNWEWNRNVQSVGKLAWLPVLTSTYSTESSTTECRFKCEENNFFNSIAYKCSNPSSLMWSANVGETTWSNAVSYCDNLTESGYDDWHLPRINELRTLIQNCSGTQTGGSCGVTDSCRDDDCENNACNGCERDSNGGHSKFGDTAAFWSSSTESSSTNYAWYVNFEYGFVDSSTKKDYYGSHAVRCVRSSEENPCIPNPCSALSHSTGTCIVNSSGYICGCQSGYNWNGSQCTSGGGTTLPACSSTISTPCKDSSTGLIWSARPSSTTWSNAVLYCDNLTEGGYTDWHLPNIDELRTLLTNADRVTDNCQVSEVHDCLALDGCWSCSTCTQTGTQSTSGSDCSSWGSYYNDERYSKFGETHTFWSSSTLSDYSTDYAWSVDFDYGTVSKSSKAGQNRIRCVRY